MNTDRKPPASVGDLFTYNDGCVRFVVLHVEDGRAWGLPLSVGHNEHGVPVIEGAFDYRNIAGGTCAGMMQLPDGAVLKADKRIAALEAEVGALRGALKEFTDYSVSGGLMGHGCVERARVEKLAIVALSSPTIAAAHMAEVERLRSRASDLTDRVITVQLERGEAVDRAEVAEADRDRLRERVAELEATTEPTGICEICQTEANARATRAEADLKAIGEAIGDAVVIVGGDPDEIRRALIDHRPKRLKDILSPALLARLEKK